MTKTINFINLSNEEKGNVLDEISSTTNVSKIILEKDFWVSFCLEKIFSSELRRDVIFKGGTSLSKCYGLIDRFSEDVDIGVLPSVLGWDAEKLKEPSSNTQKQRQTNELQKDCKKYVIDKFLPVLKNSLEKALPKGTWKIYMNEESENSGGDILFEYPSSLTYPHYIARKIKLEFGSLPKQSPIEMRRSILMMDTEEFKIPGFESKI